MKKKVWFCILFFFAYFFAFSQNYNILRDDNLGIELEFRAGEISTTTIDVPNVGRFSAANIDGFIAANKKGAPQLPVLQKVLQIPVCDSIYVVIENAEYEEYNAEDLNIYFKLYPAQGPIFKSETQHKFVIDSLLYSRDEYFTLPLVNVEKSGVFRNVSIANIAFSPLQYNPVQNTVKVCKYAKVTVKYVNPSALATQKLDKYASLLFNGSDNYIINKREQSRSELSNSPISYLIIAHSMFKNNAELEAFVSWKRKLGYYVKVAYTDEVAVGTTTASIKNYIASIFTNATDEEPAPVFLLLVGDHQQIPAFQGTTEDRNHVTDLFYATMIGDDYLPDCYYGRLSAQNQSQLSAQIEKILTYEQYTLEDPSYLGSAVLIAGYDENFSNNWGNGQINYINDNYINNNVEGYDNVKVHLHDCSSQAALIRSEIGQGAGIVNYTAHGDWDGWYRPAFENSHISSLQNYGKYGLIIGNCCLTGKFEMGECFGEALLRAQNKGAVAYIGASNSSIWDEDFYWAVGYRNNITANPSYNAYYLGVYDKMFHTHGENADVYITTVGGIVNAGNMSVQATNSTLKKYYWEIYHCFGDPSLRPYLGMPSTIDLQESPVAVVGTSQYTLFTGAPLAYVAITKDGEYITSALADVAGNATLNISNIVEPGIYELAISAQNRIPYFGEFVVVSQNEPYIVATKCKNPENTDFLTDNTISLDLTLLNVGLQPTSGVSAKITSDDPQIVMIDDSVYVGNMAVQGEYQKINAFSFAKPANLADNQTIDFVLTIKWDTVETQRIVKVRVLLPNVKIEKYAFKINNQVVLNCFPNDDVQVVFDCRNAGHQEIASGVCDLTCNYSGVTVLSTSSSIHDIIAGQQFQKTFDVKISGNVPSNSVVPLYFHTLYSNVHKIDTLQIIVGRNDETFESGSLQENNWTMQQQPWFITNQVVHSGNYSARSALNPGAFGISTMKITITTTEPSEFSFWRKTSTEAYYDVFYFKMDGNTLDQASGITDWEFVTVPVSAGTHTFSFSYQKDGSQKDGDDCVWVDDILLPANLQVVVEDINDEVGVSNYEISKISVFPNPASYSVNVQSESQISKLEIYDLNGRLVKIENSISSGNHLIDINNLNSGVYILKLYLENNNVKNFKIIKK